MLLGNKLFSWELIQSNRNVRVHNKEKFWFSTCFQIQFFKQFDKKSLASSQKFWCHIKVQKVLKMLFLNNYIVNHGLIRCQKVINTFIRVSQLACYKNWRLLLSCLRVPCWFFCILGLKNCRNGWDWTFSYI